MSLVPLASIREVSRGIQELDIDFVFVGGSVVELLLDDPALTGIRPTDDVDVVLRVFTRPPYAKVEEQLRSLGFSHDVRKGAPQCRWIYQSITVDIMPVEGGFMGLNTLWFKEALDTANTIDLNGLNVPVISSVVFLATKFSAFNDRGGKDYYGSHDLEDIIAVFDGRKNIAEEIQEADSNLKKYVIEQVEILLQDQDFIDALPGLLASDIASQQRLPLLEERLRMLKHF